jgi:hypothetical protein
MIEICELNTQHQRIYDKGKKGSNIQKLVTASCFGKYIVAEKRHSVQF